MNLKISEYSSLLFNKKEVIQLLKDVSALFNPSLEERILIKAKMPSFEEYIDKVLENGKVIISHDDKQLCGLIMFYVNDREKFTGYIPLLAIKETYAGKGLGKRLVEEALKVSRQNEMRKVLVNTWKSNKKAISLYSKCGFWVIEEKNEEIKMAIEL